MAYQPTNQSCQVRRTRSMQRTRSGDDGHSRPPGQPPPAPARQLPQEGGESWVDDELGMPGMAGQVRPRLLPGASAYGMRRTCCVEDV